MAVAAWQKTFIRSKRYSIGDALITEPDGTMHAHSTTGTVPRWTIILAFAALYLIWGATYLGIKIAIETIPPFLMSATRFMLAGAVLYGISRARGVRKPTLPEWKTCLIVGGFLIAGGNGGVTLSELWIDSSIAALVIASNPLFMTLFGWLGGVQKKPRVRAWLSLLVGFCGVGLLIGFNARAAGTGSVAGYALVLTGIVLWTTGSIYSKRNPLTLDIWLQSGMQMFCGGAICLLIATFRGEFIGLDVAAISMRSGIAFILLTLIGSLAGFTSYVYLLKHCVPSAVASHAYVNPVVAVLLGWLVLGETLSPGGAAGSLLVLVSVYELLRQK